MAKTGKIYYSKIEFTDEYVAAHYTFPVMFFITDNINKIKKQITYDATGKKSISSSFPSNANDGDVLVYSDGAEVWSNRLTENEAAAAAALSTLSGVLEELADIEQVKANKDASAMSPANIISWQEALDLPQLVEDYNDITEALSAEVTARQNADIAEANARTFADGLLDSKIAAEKNRNDSQDLEIAKKLDKPTADGTWVVKKEGSAYSYVAVSGDNIATANLTWTVDRSQNLGTKKLSFTNGRFSVPTLEMEITSATSVPNKIWNKGTKPTFTDKDGINKDLAFDADKLDKPTSVATNPIFALALNESNETFKVPFGLLDIITNIFTWNLSWMLPLGSGGTYTYLKIQSPSLRGNGQSLDRVSKAVSFTSTDGITAFQRGGTTLAYSENTDGARFFIYTRKFILRNYIPTELVFCGMANYGGSIPPNALIEDKVDSAYIVGLYIKPNSSFVNVVTRRSSTVVVTPTNIPVSINTAYTVIIFTEGSDFKVKIIAENIFTYEKTEVTTTVTSNYPSGIVVSATIFLSDYASGNVPVVLDDWGFTYLSKGYYR